MIALFRSFRVNLFTARSRGICPWPRAWPLPWRDPWPASIIMSEELRTVIFHRIIGSSSSWIVFCFKRIISSMSSKSLCVLSSSVLSDRVSMQLEGYLYVFSKYHLTVSYLISVHHIISYYIVLYHVILYHMILYYIISCYIVLYHVLSYFIVSYFLQSNPIQSNLV